MAKNKLATWRREWTMNTEISDFYTECYMGVRFTIWSDKWQAEHFMQLKIGRN